MSHELRINVHAVLRSDCSGLRDIGAPGQAKHLEAHSARGLVI